MTTARNAGRRHAASPFSTERQTMVRHVFLFVLLLSTLGIARAMPSSYSTYDLCNNDIVMGELERMNDSESMVFDHITLDQEMDLEYQEARRENTALRAELAQCRTGMGLR